MISTRALVSVRVAAEQPLAERQPEALDLGAGVLPGGGVDQVLQRFAGQEARRAAVDERVGEVAFEAAGDGQVAGVVAIAAAHDPEHAQVRLAVAAGTDSKHGGTIAQGRQRQRRRQRRLPATRRPV